MSTIKQDINSGNCHKKLNRAKVSNGVIALMDVLILDAESASEFDLTKLNQAYILDPYVREEINALIKEAIKKSNNPSVAHEKLDRVKVIRGVAAMVNALNLTAGSAGDFNLYEANLAYLLNPEMRDEMDSLLKGW